MYPCFRKNDVYIFVLSMETPQDLFMTILRHLDTLNWRMVYSVSFDFQMKHVWDSCESIYVYQLKRVWQNSAYDKTYGEWLWETCTRLIVFDIIVINNGIATDLSHWGRDKMAANHQRTSSNAFSWMKCEISVRCHWSFAPKGPIICQH